LVAEELELQIPISNTQRSSKFQIPKAFGSSLELGYWPFSGAWMLEFGPALGFGIQSLAISPGW
jgi:hypothetical protein